MFSVPNCPAHPFVDPSLQRPETEATGIRPAGTGGAPPPRPNSGSPAPSPEKPGTSQQGPTLTPTQAGAVGGPAPNAWTRPLTSASLPEHGPEILSDEQPSPLCGDRPDTTSRFSPWQACQDSHPSLRWAASILFLEPSLPNPDSLISVISNPGFPQGSVVLPFSSTLPQTGCL